MKSLSIIALLIFFSQNIQAKIANESELGILLAKGNSDSQSYSAKEVLSERWDNNSLKFDGRYLQTKTSGIENARFWLTGLRYDRELSTRLATFLGEILESNKFAGYNQKYNSDIGFKYALTKEEKFLWNVELGYRYTVENQLSGTSAKLHYIRSYIEAEKKWAEGVTTKLWFEYLPNFTTGSDYQMNSEFSVSAALNNVFSLKSGYLLRYDNLPNPGAVAKTDTLLTTALVAKF